MNSIKKTIVFALTGALAMSLLSGCGKETLDGTKTVAIVDGEELPLGVLSLYARQQQAMYENFYQAYMGSTPGWDNVVDEETNQTYGEQMVQTSLDTIEEMMLLKAKAADYGVEISDEDRENIKKAAEEFMAANSEETIKELSITQEQVETYLELQTYQTRMYDAVRAAAEVEITDEQATQSTFSYVSITVENQDAEATEETTEETEEA
ncbi:MAG: FKBP-type peptidylprolyl isomerase, partial [Eubacteriales bacterium]|nr:FKBP-type peptidylprolyl isomerase [Eubacteriales bacterium]